MSSPIRHTRTLAYARLGTSIFGGGQTREQHLETLEHVLPSADTVWPGRRLWTQMAFDPYISPEGHQYAVFESNGQAVMYWFTGPLAEKSTLKEEDIPPF